MHYLVISASQYFLSLNISYIQLHKVLYCHEYLSASQFLPFFFRSFFLSRYMYIYFQLHMFDVDLGPHMKITESELNEPGKSLTTVQIGKMG